MSSLLVALDPATLSILAVSGFLLGLALLLTGTWSQRRRNLVLFLSGCLAVGFALSASLWPALARLQISLIGFAGLCAAFVLLSWGRSRQFFSTAWAVARDPRVQGALLLLVAPMVALGWSWQAQREVEHQMASTMMPRDEPLTQSRPQKEYASRTDRGTSITLYDVSEHETRVSDQAAEAKLIESHGLTLQLIRLAAPDRASNCHGWVYTGGRYYVDAVDVPAILKDNGYQAVSDPRPGDLVVYKDRFGCIMHSAVVRAVTDTGLVLLQSKWAHLGCFLHEPKDYCLADTWTYYRSPRTGHLLNDLPER